MSIAMPIMDAPQQVAAVHPLRFYLTPRERKEQDPANPLVPKTKTVMVEWCDWAKKGVERPTTGGDAISRLMKDPSVWAAIKPFYENWKAGGADVVINGTPLTVWAGIGGDMVELLRPYRIYSVEDLAGMTDSVMQKIPHPDIVRVRDRAKKFVETKDVADAVRALGDKEDVIKAQAEQLASLQAQVQTLMAANAITSGAASKGRRKVAEAAE